MGNITSGKLLTISIPTWNRAKYLDELLEQLTLQISSFHLEKKIELLVSNNNSDDNTEKVVSGLLEKFNFITYNRNTENIGAKSNVIKSMELASSEFVLILGDDDRIREDCLVDIIKALENAEKPGILIDLALLKVKNIFNEGEIALENLIKNFYWYIGNAGVFILRTEFVREALEKYDYNLFNECWPQTQIMILGETTHPEYRCYLFNMNIHSKGEHGEVMIYNSFYLWRTCYLELVNAINNIKEFISVDVYIAARKYLISNIKQQVFNILQCGLFIDDRVIRKKTSDSIFRNLYKFTLSEKIYILTIAIILSFPIKFTRFISNLFIFILRGKKGLQKKNDYVQKEINKLAEMKNGSVRTLEFEADS